MPALMLRQRLYQLYWQRISHWLDKRQPAAPEVQLHHKMIFILPTRYGLWFLLLIFLLYLLGTNYQNNLILLLDYLLLAVFLLSIVLCFSNLRGLSIRPAAGGLDGFAATTLQVGLQLTTPHPCHMFNVGFIGQTAITQQFCDSSILIKVPLQVSHRGRFSLPRLRIASCYPFGLWRAWSYVALSQPYCVYPQPRQPQANLAGADARPDKQKVTEAGDTLTEYRPGDSLRYIVWKRLAREPDKPIVRQPKQATPGNPQWVVVPPASGLSLELALSHACYQILELDRLGSQYGLQLPAKTVPQSGGALHLQRCLQELALC